MDKFITPCIIQTLIIAICITVIIITYLRGKHVKPNSCNVCIEGNGEKRRKLHLIYMSSMASGIIILLFTYITVNSTGYSNINSYFSFASTIVSIVLAIVTIVYSISTSEVTANSLGSIEKTTDTVNKAAQEVRDASMSYSKSASSLDENIRKILESMGRIEHYTSAALSAVASSEETPIEIFTQSGKNSTEGFIEGYLNSGSIAGCTALYACFKSFEKQKKFNVNILSDQNEQQMYMYAYIISSSSIGLITASVNFNNGDIDVTNVIPEFNEKIKNWIETPKPNELKEHFDLDIIRINQYFN